VSDGDESRVYAVESIEAKNYFDFITSYQVSEGFALNFGIKNLLDNEPPLLGSNQSRANTFPATYDLIGRSYYTNVFYFF
jgi:iron complex outermembrane receptor protein